MANRTSNKANATRTSPVAEQEELDTDWVEATSTTLSTQPTELNVDVTSTTTSLVSSSTLTQGQEVTLVESDNSYTDGVLGAVTGPSGLASSTDPFGDGSLIRKLELNGNITATVGANGVFGGTPAYGTGVFGQSAEFSGTENITHTDTAISTDHTISVRLKIPSFIGIGEAIISSNAGGWNGSAWSLQNASSNYLMNIQSGTDFSFGAIADLADNEWHSLVFTITAGGVWNVYLDNVNVVSNHASTLASWNNTIFELGSQIGGQKINSASYDQFEVYNKILTEQERTDLYTQTETRYTADITSYSLATAPTKAFLKDDTSISLAIESTPERIVNEVSTHLTVLDTALLTDVDPFGDSSGIAGYTLNDGTDGLLSNLGVTGSYNGTATDVTYGTGKFGNCAIFNGATSKIVTSGTASFAGEFSVSLFAKTASASDGTYDAIFATGAYVGAAFVIFLDLNGKANIYFSNTPKIISSTSIADNNFNHIVVTRDASNLVSLYINNSLEGTVTQAGDFTGTSMFLGWENTAGTQFTGSIDQVRIFNKALSTYEVSTLYNEGQVGTDTTNLVVTEPIYEGEKLFIDDTEVTLGAVTGAGPYTVAHGLGTTPTKAYRKGSKALSASSSVNTEFEVMTYDGTTAIQTVGLANITTGVDFVWAKIRDNSGASGHEPAIYDSIRGASKYLMTSNTNAEGTAGVNGFGADYFTLDANITWNNTGGNHVAWCASLPTHTVSNTDGTITSETKANSFMSVISYTQSTVTQTAGHSLASKPELVIRKRVNGVSDWYTGIDVGSINGYMLLNSTAAIAGAFTVNDTTFETAFLGTGTEEWIAYAFTSVAGKCKVGSYTGTGTNNQAITGIGFEPAWVMIKKTSFTGDWVIFDNQRAGSNSLHANESVIEQTVANISFDSDGFTITNHTDDINTNTSTYIYLAIAKEVTNPNTTGKLYGSSDTTGMITAGDTVLVDNNKPVVASAVTEGTDTVWRANNQFETVLYAGNSSTQTIPMANIDGGVDFVWTKSRTNVWGHQVWDSLRGATKVLNTSLTNSEDTIGNGVISLDADSFTAGGYEGTNNAANYVAWCASLPNHTVSNTAGTITSETKSNDFMSVISYTGTGANATVGHGLSKAPELWIVKGRTTAYNWVVGSTQIANTERLLLDTTNAKVSVAGGSWNSTYPSDTVISLGGNLDVNTSTASQIAYAFTSVAGLCKVGSYTGDGSTSNHVSCGFTPSFLLVKNTTTASDWVMFDGERGSSARLQPNLADAESVAAFFTFDSDGFTVLVNHGQINTLNNKYIFLAIADTSKVSLPSYDITIPTQASAPTTVAVPDNTQKLTVTSKLFDGTKFNYTYGSYVKQGRAMATKLESTTSGTTVLSPITTNLNKA